MSLTSTRRSYLCLLFAVWICSSLTYGNEDSDAFAPFHCPKEHVYVYCGELHDDLDHYGYPKAYYGHHIDVKGPWVKEHLDKCGKGSIERKWQVKSGYDWVWCKQVIHITDPHGHGFDASKVYWPKDYHMKECGGSLHPDELPAHYSWPEFGHKGCAKLGLRYYDKSHPIHSTYGGYGHHSYGHACKVIHRTWELIDWCQYNSGYGGYGAKGKWTYVQKIYVYDEEAPTITFCSDDIDANGGDCKGGKTFVKIPKVEATDDCGTVYYAFSRKKIEEGQSYHSYSGGGVRYSGSDASGYYEPGKTMVTFEAFDVCGNTTKCQMIVNVEALDTKPPSVIGISSLTAVLVQSDTNDGEIELWPSEFNTSSSDNCTAEEDLKFSLEPSVFTCEDFGSNQVKFIVTDEAGNSDYIMVEVIVQANSFECLGGVVSGNVSSDAGQGIDDVHVRLMDGMEQMTDYEGAFSFDDIPLGRDITLFPTKVGDDMRGIDMYDYALLSLHVDGIRELTDPYQLVAADVNADQRIDHRDLIALQRLIAGIDKGMTGDSWKIFARDYQFPDTVSALQVDIPASYTISNYDGRDMHVDFMAIKVGDLGELVVDPIGDNGVGQKSVVVTDQVLEEKQTYRIPFTFEEGTQANSITFTLDVDANRAELLQIHPSAMASKGVLEFVESDDEPGHLAVTWYSFGEQSFGADEVLFEIVIEANHSATLSQVLTINSDLAEAKAKGKTGGVHRLDLAYGTNVKDQSTLFQNAPNPFTESTVISFYMAQAGEASLSIKDATGKQVLDREGHFEAGQQQVIIRGDDLQTKGLLFYSLTIGDTKLTKKMLVIN